MPAVRFGGGGGGGGGLHFRSPQDVFANATERNTYFTASATSKAYQQFAKDRSLAIIIGTIARPTAFQTYTGDAGSAYSAAAWLNRTDAVQGTPGGTGAQGRYTISIHLNSAAAPLPATPVGGSFNIGTGRLTLTGLPAGTSVLPAQPGQGENVYVSEAVINPKVQTGAVVPVWSPWVERSNLAGQTQAQVQTAIVAAVTGLIGGSPANRNTLNEINDVVIALAATVAAIPNGRTAAQVQTAVAAAIAALVDGAPANRNTIKEINDALVALNATVAALPAAGVTTGQTVAQVNALIQAAFATALSNNTETGISVVLNQDGTIDFVVGAAPMQTHKNYIGITARALANVTATDFTVSGVAAKLVIPDYTGSMRLLFARPASLSDPTGILLYNPGFKNSFNSIGVFRKSLTTLQLGGEVYNWWGTVDLQSGYGGYILEQLG